MFLRALLMDRGGSPMGSCCRQTGQRRLSAGTATASAAFRHCLQRWGQRREAERGAGRMLAVRR